MSKYLLALLLTAAAAAQTRPSRPVPKKAAAPAPAPDQFPIESLTIEGNHFYTREQVLAVAGLKVGQMGSKAVFEAARQRLTDSGAFENVGYEFRPGSGGQGYAVKFEVTEVESAYPVRFEELGVPDRDIEAMLKARDPLFSTARLPATRPVLDRYTAWVQQFLNSKGLTEKIAGRVTALSADQFAIVFRPARNLPAVAQVSFEGNQVIPQSALREAVHGSAVGSPYTEDRFREILNIALRPLYEARGRIRVKFPKLRTEAAKTVDGLNVFVTVDEGPSYELGKVAIDGPSPVSPEGLLKIGDFKTGDVANFDRVNEGLERIRKAVRRAGFLDAKVTADRKIDDAEKKVDLGVRIEPGPQYTMGKLTISGLDLDGEAEMNRIWTMKEGKPFNPEYPDLFLSRVREMFDSLGQTKADIHVNQNEHTADVTLQFSGTSDAKPGRKKR
ncbi:MAG TPA: POTRA domain-containing protein [Bryobacteraceae bacterium]|jgi:outer membrane protein assembly factor BamA